ncbi:DNA polymerase III delta prime subunit [Lunatimonas lonarensis]|uniref:DNA polymerase III delta prime subunit n=1 Tax=Lunatimonas lonarensis TaxID=1232681 RepID=R7ZNB7_9BACT|nr:hypothetical protein [Lunatimonas lonarensis]EON75577.1 DNA polymerase III delta prime subunit [Lunatimonas lonarensis]
MQFSSIPGLSETKSKLIQASRQDHLAHALLFHGPEGSAALPMALALAAYVNCENPSPTDSCGTCPSCQKVAKLIHPDLNFAFPIPGSLIPDSDDEPKKKVDILKPWRSFLLNNPYSNLHDWILYSGFDRQLIISKAGAKQIIQTLSLKSFEGGYKIMLIWTPELMNLQSANALLKILEEPPAKTLFFMVSHHPERLLTTILSRTQKVLIRGFSDEEIISELVDRGLCSESAALQLAPLADGSMREAFLLADEVKDENTSKVRDWLRICYGRDINAICAFAEEFFAYPKESQKTLLLTAINVLRECLIDKSQQTQLMRSPESEREFIHKLATNVLTTEKIDQIYQQLGEAYIHLERNANSKILSLDLSLSVARILR